MGMKLMAIAAAVLAGSALAACPNLCSGHGNCGAHDICACFDGWEGYDCSLRTCPVNEAWVVDAANPHDYSVCSGQGKCNSATGECECFPGFTGRACSRLACPNGCSGNGKCVYITDAATTPYSSSNWDARRIETCVCDPGFFGPDCSQRYCPTGDDPLTVCDADSRSHVQEIRFTLGSLVQHEAESGTDGTYAAGTETLALFGTSGTATFSTVREEANINLHLQYTDAFGAQYIAHAPGHVLSSTDEDAAVSLEIALETLPESKVYDVKVATAMTRTGLAFNSGIDNVIERRYLITFAPADGSQNVGLQNDITCSSGYSCTEAGCQPIVHMPFLYRYAGTTTPVAVGTVVSIGNAGNIRFFSGSRNSDANFNALSFIRLHPDSQPQLPNGIEVDTGITSSSTARYDTRILIAVVDPDNNQDDDVDVYYTRVIHGHDNIANSGNEAVGTTLPGVWTSAMTGADEFTATLDGFTYNGRIPSDYSKVPVPGAPGVFITFAGQDYADSAEGRWFEIVIKLPHCTVTPANEDMYELSDTVNKVPLVDTQVENIECSARGNCNRLSGACECFNGFTGKACETFTAVV